MPNMEDFYETNSVGAGRDSYSCEYCGGTIKKGSPSDVHKFYPEFQGYRTHPKCSDKFLEQESCSECCENHDPKDLVDLNGAKYCKQCQEDCKEEIDKAKVKAEKAAAAKKLKAAKKEEEWIKKNPEKHAEKIIRQEIGLKIIK